MTTTLTYHISCALERARPGDPSDYSRPFELIRSRALAYARSILQDDEAAEDVVQQAFVAAFEGLTRLEDSTGFESWIMEFVRRCGKHDKSRRRFHSEIETIEEAEARDFERDVLNKFEGQAVRNAIAGLPETYRVPVVLHHVQGRPLAEIAARLSLTLGTVKMRLNHARESLRNQLRAWEPNNNYRRPDLAKPIEYVTSYVLDPNPYPSVQPVTTVVYDILPAAPLTSNPTYRTSTYPYSPDSRITTMIA